MGFTRIIYDLLNIPDLLSFALMFNVESDLSDLAAFLFRESALMKQEATCIFGSRKTS